MSATSDKPATITVDAGGAVLMRAGCEQLQELLRDDLVLVATVTAADKDGHPLLVIKNLSGAKK